MLEVKLETGFKLISKLLPDPVFLMSLDGTILDVSPMSIRRYGFNKEDFLGKNITELEFLPPDGKKALNQNLARRLQGEKIAPYEISLHTKDGEERFFEVNSSSTKSGEETLDIVLFRDITILRQAEQAFRETERGWLDIFNSLDDLVLLIDTEFNVIQVNKAVMELVRKHGKEIDGQKCYKLMHNRNEPVENCPSARCLETGNVETLEYYDPELDKYFLLKATPILDKEKKIMAIFHLIRDITEHKKAEEQHKKDYEDMVLSLAIALEARDTYTKGHSDRVKRYCRAIARQMGLPAKQIQDLERAASLHDIGKIAVPDAILNKRGRLTPPELAQIQQHPEKSVDLIRLIPNPPNTLLAIRHHHERVDGKGYPGGLVGDNIPLEARILAVADAYDALTSPRSYRTAFTHEEALQILKENAGIQWDAKVVESAIEALGK